MCCYVLLVLWIFLYRILCVSVFNYFFYTPVNHFRDESFWAIDFASFDNCKKKQNNRCTWNTKKNKCKNALAEKNKTTKLVSFVAFESGSRLVLSDTLSRADCYLLPTLQHIRVLERLAADLWGNSDSLYKHSFRLTTVCHTMRLVFI